MDAPTEQVMFSSGLAQLISRGNVAMIFCWWQRWNYCCCLCWMLTLIRKLHASATSSYFGPVGNIECSLHVKVYLRSALSSFIDNNLESYVGKLAMLVWIFLLCCTEQTHNKALGLLSNSTLIMTYVLWHSDSIYHLHSSQLQTQSSEHEDMKLISNWFPRPNQRADQNKDFEAFITIYERVTRQCHLLCFWWLARGCFGKMICPWAK